MQIDLSIFIKNQLMVVCYLDIIIHFYINILLFIIIIFHYCIIIHIINIPIDCVDFQKNYIIVIIILFK